jgi:hypothetical protein
MEADLMVTVKKPDGGTYKTALTIAQFIRKQAVIRTSDAIVTIMLDQHANWNGEKPRIEVGRLAVHATERTEKRTEKGE